MSSVVVVAAAVAVVVAAAVVDVVACFAVVIGNAAAFDDSADVAVAVPGRSAAAVVADSVDAYSRTSGADRPFRTSHTPCRRSAVTSVAAAAAVVAAIDDRAAGFVEADVAVGNTNAAAACEDAGPFATAACDCVVALFAAVAVAVETCPLNDERLVADAEMVTACRRR